MKATLLIYRPVISGSKDPWDFICRDNGLVMARIEDKAWWKRFMNRGISIGCGDALEVLISPFKAGDVRLIMHVKRLIPKYAKHISAMDPGVEPDKRCLVSYFVYASDGLIVKIPEFDEEL